jgi:membrane-associated protease RseP (regulator of RpoE activity)
MPNANELLFNRLSPTETDPGAITRQARAIVEGDMEIASIEVPLEPRREGVVVFKGRLIRPSDEAYTRWLAAFRQIGYTPVLRDDTEVDAPEAGKADGYGGAVILHIMAGVPHRSMPRVWLNIALFVITFISTLFAGSMYAGPVTPVNTLGDLFRPANLLTGWPFAMTLLGILAAHEFGHYFAARYHKVAVSLPFFIPMPLGFGTLGAVIQMKEPVPDRRKLFDIGVAGPLTGLVLAIPLLLVGLSTSPVVTPTPSPGMMLEGNSILYYFAKIAVFGKVLPNPITGEDVLMNQVTFAAWIGLLVTAINLLPVGQLDGGHAVYALFGRQARYVNVAALVAMAFLAVAGLEPLQRLFPVLMNIGYSGWFLWLGLLFVVVGPFHPPALNDVTRLDAARRRIGYLVIVLFILIFVPAPFRPLF